MADTDQDKFKDLLNEILELRDETRLKIHLGSKELQDEWHEMEEKWKKFSRDADLAKSGQDLKNAFGMVGEELKNAYVRIKAAI